MFSTGFTSNQCLTFYQSLSLSWCMVFDSISCNTDEVPSINPSANVFVFGGLPIMVELVDLVNFVIIFLSQMTLLRWLTFQFRLQTVILIAVVFWIYFFLDTSICSTMTSLHWEILIMLLSQFSLTFYHIHNGMPHFIALLMTILMLIGKVFMIIWEMFNGGKIYLNSVFCCCLWIFWVGWGCNWCIYPS